MIKRLILVLLSWVIVVDIAPAQDSALKIKGSQKAGPATPGDFPNWLAAGWRRVKLCDNGKRYG